MSANAPADPKAEPPADAAERAQRMAGIDWPGGSATLRNAVELLSSMRFAISLLTLICIASVIGTVVQQNQPAANYLNQFGPFWYDVFGKLSLYSVYSAGWFLAILAFLVLSTSLCIARNAPKIASDLRTFKEKLREQSLRAFGQRGEGRLDGEDRAQAVLRIGQALRARGYALKLDAREGATLIAAKAGGANKLGYLAAHGSIVLICVGGLLDGEMAVRAYMAATGKTPTTQNMAIKDVPPQHRLPASSPAYRGNVFVAEGAQVNAALLNFNDGVILQELPFALRLDKFIVDYYSTGMPKLFASEVTVTRAGGEQIKGRIEVNKPLVVDGIAIYQSSFDDGGSKLRLLGYPMIGASSKTLAIEGEVGGSTELKAGLGRDGASDLTLEFTGLRVINVENLARAGSDGADPRRVDLREAISAQLGSGARTRSDRQLRNIGPSVTYKLRDAAGQAREFHNYMLPVEIDGARVVLAGVRSSPNEQFRYLRIPVDEQDGVEGFMRLRAALASSELRALAAERFAELSTAGSGERAAELRRQLQFSTGRALDMFAGAAAAGKDGAGGLQALSDFLESTVPEKERINASEMFLRLINGGLYQLLVLAYERAGLKPPAQDEATGRFLSQAMLALSDSFVYGAPLYFKLTDFDHVQASVFQVAKAPGHYLVYLGCALLIVGIFAMLYVRERRIWVLVKGGGGEPGSVLLAYSSTRQTLDTDAEFDDWCRRFGLEPARRAAAAPSQASSGAPPAAPSADRGA